MTPIARLFWFFIALVLEGLDPLLGKEVPPTP